MYSLYNHTVIITPQSPTSHLPTSHLPPQPNSCIVSPKWLPLRRNSAAGDGSCEADGSGFSHFAKEAEAKHSRRLSSQGTFHEAKHRVGYLAATSFSNLMQILSLKTSMCQRVTLWARATRHVLLGGNAHRQPPQKAPPSTETGYLMPTRDSQARELFNSPLSLSIAIPSVQLRLRAGSWHCQGPCIPSSKNTPFNGDKS